MRPRDAAHVEETTIVGTLLISLAIGMWAGATEQEHDPRRFAERWTSAAALIVLAAVFASLATSFGAIVRDPWRGVVTLAAMILPFYGLGFTMPSLQLWARHRHEEEDSTWTAADLVPIGVTAGLGLGIIFAGFVAAPVWTPGATLVSAALLLFLPTTVREDGPREIREEVLYETTTPYGALQVTEVSYRGERQAERRLYLNGEEESGELVRSGAPALGYVAAAEIWLSSSTPPGSKYLFLGGGAYTLPRRIAERDPRATIRVVELDPEVTRIAHEFFGVKPTHGIATSQGDARAFLDSAGEGHYDRIYVDVYGGGEALPHSVVTVEALGSMNRLLSPDGAIGMNVIGDAAGDERVRLWSVVETVSAVFPMVALYVHIGRDFPDRQNFLIIASQDVGRRTPPAIGTFDLWPKEDWPEVSGTLIFRDLQPSHGSTSRMAASTSAGQPGPQRTGVTKAALGASSGQSESDPGRA